jgi:hypothetical protein
VQQTLVLSALGLAAPANATHGSNDWLVPTANYDQICLSVGNDWRDGPGAVCQTDNAGVFWYADSSDPGELESNDVTQLQNVLTNQYAPTDLTLTYDSTPVFSGTAQTDLIFQEEDTNVPIPSGTLGITWCDSSAPAFYECDQTYLRLDGPDGYRIYSGSVACHETGHAVGLVHGDLASPMLDPGNSILGCMVNEDEFPSNLGSASAHQINLHY